MNNIKIAASNPFGPITAPPGMQRIASAADIGSLLSAVISILVIGAGIYAVINFILAGYGYISSSGNPQGIQAATAKIWHSALGLTVAAGALLIASVVGQIVFGNPTALINPTIFGI